MTFTELVTFTHPSLTHREQAESLVERLQRGDPTAISEAYDAHHSSVRAFAKRLVGEVAAAEDLVHDVFVALPAAMKGYRGEASLRTFLISVAVNRARHHVRAAARRRHAMALFEDEPKATPVDPEYAARRRELAEALLASLDALPLEQRVAFVLCEVEERSSGEVAEIVGVPEGTVRTRLFHGKRKLRELLNKEGFR